MNAKKLILTGLSVFCFAASLLAQDSRGKQAYKDGMDEEDHTPVMKTRDVCLYSRNLISLMPFQFTENGVGTGLSWEYTLDHDGYLGLYIPVVATFNPNKSAYNGASTNNNDMMFYAMPGLKFYPTGLGKVKYAVGPSVVIATGQVALPDDKYHPYLNYPSYLYQTNVSHSIFGMLINNSLNINPNARLHVGLEVGLGFSYVDRVDGVNFGASFLAQGNFSIGYRF